MKKWAVFRPIPVTHLKEIWISWKKNGVLQFFERVAGPDNNFFPLFLGMECFQRGMKQHGISCYKDTQKKQMHKKNQNYLKVWHG